MNYACILHVLGSKTLTSKCQHNGRKAKRVVITDPKQRMIIDKENITVYPVALGNGGTALKPAIQLDERYKVNVGLKESKIGENTMSLFTEQAQIVQIRVECTMLSKPNNVIIRYADVTNCQSSCVDCTRSNILCNQCKEKGFVSHIPSLRPCSRCLENDRKCIRRVVVAFSVDCEEGNKKCLLELKRKIEQDNRSTFTNALSPSRLCSCGKSM